MNDVLRNKLSKVLNDQILGVAWNVFFNIVFDTFDIIAVLSNLLI